MSWARACAPMDIDLVGHEGGNSRGDFCFNLDITDIATGRTEIRSVRNKAQKWVCAAIKDATTCFPFPILGIDSDYADVWVMSISARRALLLRGSGAGRSA